MTMEGYKHFFFDLDNTLCESRQELTEEMKSYLKILSTKGDIIVVSGAKMEQIEKQLGGEMLKYVYILAQNGNHACDEKGDMLWEDDLTDKERKEIEDHMNRIFHKYSELFNNVLDVEDLIQDRGCQVSLSLVGHNAPREMKDTFDPDRKIRLSILNNIVLDSIEVEVAIGGTTCLDYIRKGRNKGFNVKRLSFRNDWETKKCIYVGDALFEGGNDGSVIGICPILKVKNPHDTLTFIRGIVGYPQVNPQ